MKYTKGKELGNYVCGCHIHRDSEGFYLIDWCEKHKAVDDLYEALKLALPRITLLRQLGDKPTETQITIQKALAKAEGK